MALPNIISEINTIKSTYLPLSGGTMTGTIKKNGFLAQNIVDDNILIIRGGTDATSAFLGLCGKNHTNKGMAYLCACDGTNTTNFCVHSEGYATLAGSKVITSAGGTITGNLVLSNICCNKLNSSTTWGVGTTWNDAPSISLYGPNETSSGIPNCFSIRAGANKYSLTGKPDGTLTWGGNLIRTANNMLPNMASAISLAKGTNVTITSYGWVLFRNTVYQTGADGYYNNVIVWKVLGTSNAFEDWNHIMIPVGPGDIVKLIVSKGTAEMLFFANKT